MFEYPDDYHRGPLSEEVADLDGLPDEYLEAEYPDVYRARREAGRFWRYYGPWY